MSDSISVYYGEMLTSPVPLELSLNYCSHVCSYCFANLNDRNRTADVPAIMRLLQNFRDRESFEAKLLQKGYPVLISNRVDPFATSNYQVSLPIMKVMTELGIPITFQTRGGRGIDDALEFLKPSVWYISINMMDDNLRKKLEPGAPTVESRFDLIKKLKKKGHRVVVGYNPCVEEWQPNPTELCSAIKKAGAEGVWVERLHFNSKQTTVMLPREKAAIGHLVISKARKRNRDENTWAYFMKVRKAVVDAGLEVFSIYQPNATEFFKPWRDVYEHTFPIIQDLVNVCHGEGPCLVPFTAFVDLMMERLPNGKLPWGHCVAVTSGSVFNTHKIPNQMETIDFLNLVWSDSRMKQSPSRTSCMAYAVTGEGDEVGLLADADGFPTIAFTDDPDGFDDYYVNVDSVSEEEIVNTNFKG